MVCVYHIYLTPRESTECVPLDLSGKMDSFSIWFSLGMFFTLLLENSCVSPDHLEGNPLAVVPCSQEVTERSVTLCFTDAMLGCIVPLIFFSWWLL